MKRSVLVSAAAAALLGALALWAGQRANDHRVVQATLSTLPELADAAPALRAEIEAAMADAGRWERAVEGLGRLARLYHANGYLDEAAGTYAVLERLEPDEPLWRHLHALILAGYGGFDEACARWREVLARAPDYLPARLRLAEAALKTNAMDEAAEIYAAILRRWPDQPYAVLGRARIDYEAGRWEAARERLEWLVQKTDHQLGYDLIVSVYERLNHQAEADSIRGQMKASGAYRDPQDPWAEALLDLCYDPYRLAVAAGSAPTPERARHLLDRAIALAPDQVSYRMQLANLLVEANQIPAAVQQLRECTRRDPAFPDGWAQLAAHQQKAGDQAAAVQTIREGLQHCPDSPGLRLMWGKTLRQMGRREEARRELEKSIRLRPNEAAAYIELGQTYVELGQVREGLRQLHLSLEMEPDNPAAITFLAFFAISTANEPGADEWMARAARQPRVGEGPWLYLQQAYRETFGHPWLQRR